MIRWLSIALLLAAASVPHGTAQMHASFPRGGAHRAGLHHGIHHFHQGIVQGSPFLYSDYDYSEPLVEIGVENPAPGFPPTVLMLAPIPPADDSSRPAKARPLLIEKQGDRYVRFGGMQETDASGAEYPQYAERRVTRATELPPPVLVYRDGHNEEIADYAIINGVVYVRGNDWQSGETTKRIPLSALDLPGTVQANRQRGIRFMLPSAPNVLIASF